MRKFIILFLLATPLISFAQKQIQIENPFIIMSTDNNFLDMMMTSEAAPDSLKVLWQGLELEESIVITYDEEQFTIESPMFPDSKTHQVRKIGEDYVIIKTADGDYGYFHISNKQLYVMSAADDSNFLIGYGRGINEMRETIEFIKTQLSAYGREQREVIAELIERFNRFDY